MTALTQGVASIQIRPKAPPAFLVLGSIASLVIAGVLPESTGPGLFLLISGVLAGAACRAAGAIPSTPRGIGFGLAGLALLGIGTFRDAAWIVSIGILAALGCAALAVSAGNRWSDVLLGLILPAARAFIVPAFLIRGASPAREAVRGRVGLILRTLLTSGGLVVLFGAIFASADPVFSSLAGRLLPALDLGSAPIRIFLFTITLWAISAFAVPSPAVLTRRVGDEVATFKRPAIGPVEWSVSLVALSAMFVTFLIVQLAVLFGGHDYVLRTSGLTYAEYARGGFFQLLIAAMLTLAVIAAASATAVRPTPRHNLLFKTLLGILCVCTLVFLGSAFRRLGLYEEAFGFTRERFTAHAITVLLGLIFIAVMLAGVWKAVRDRLPLIICALATAAVLGSALMNPDHLIAERNIARFRATGALDAEYLAGLSTDALPAMAALPEPIRGCLTSRVVDHLESSESWLHFNLARTRARRYAQQSPEQVCATISDAFAPNYENATA